MDPVGRRALLRVDEGITGLAIEEAISFMSVLVESEASLLEGDGSASLGSTASQGVIGV